MAHSRDLGRKLELCIHIFLNVDSSVCMLLALSYQNCVDTAQTIGVLLSGEDHLSHSQLSLVACGSLCGVEALWAFPSPLQLAHYGVLARLTFRQSRL